MARFGLQRLFGSRAIVRDDFGRRHRAQTAALPAIITTSLFALEKSTRSSVVLGLVGAGGIGLQLKVAMDMFDYRQAATIRGLMRARAMSPKRGPTSRFHSRS